MKTIQYQVLHKRTAKKLSKVPLPQIPTPFAGMEIVQNRLIGDIFFKDK